MTRVNLPLLSGASPNVKRYLRLLSSKATIALRRLRSRVRGWPLLAREKVLVWRIVSVWASTLPGMARPEYNA